VLPFTNISPDAQDSYFADGLTEELITTLSKVRGLRIIARTSTSHYSGTSKSVSQIGSELQAGTVLEGSVRKAGNKIRVTAQLIEASGQEHLWADQYDRDLTDIFSIQSDIARHVSEELKVALLSDEQKRIEKAETTSVSAHVAYLRGRTLLRDRSEKALRAAEEQFELAIKHDPNYAQAYAGLADVHQLLWDWGFAPRAECQEKSKALVKKALELDSNLPEACLSLAELHFDDYRFAEAEEVFKRAIALIPSNATAHLWYCVCLLQLGRQREALTEVLRAEELDPLSPVIISWVHDIYYDLGDLEQALNRLQKLKEIDPEGRITLVTFAYHYLREADYDQALIALKKCQQLWPVESLAASGLAYVYAVTGRRQEAFEILERLQDDFNRRGSVEASQIAWVYCVLDDIDECFVWLEKAFKARETKFFSFYRFSPLAEKVRKDPRFTDLLRRANLPLQPVN